MARESSELVMLLLLVIIIIVQFVNCPIPTLGMALDDVHQKAKAVKQHIETMNK